MQAANPRRATAYLLVLVAVLVTVSIGVTGTMVHKVRRDRLSRAWEIERAHQIAQAGMELSVAYLQSDQSWRTLRGLGVWMNNAPLLDGTVTVTASDPDGSATDDPEDDITLTSEGRFGKARQVITATFTPIPVAMDSLSYSASAGDAIGFNGTLNATEAVAANGAATALLANVFARVYAGSTISGLTYRRAIYPNSGTRQHPNPATVFDWYVANGTTISFASLPSGILERVVLAPNHNPFGATNPLGIYVIDCAGANIRIRNCRIEGTLVLLNTGTSSDIQQSVNWKPAANRMPALLVKGRIAIELTTTALSEVTHNTNFNPSTAPYNGQSDNDRVDTYPSQLHGLVYASDDIAARENSAVTGPLIAADDIAFAGTVNITFDGSYATLPPRGFISRYNMRLKAETLARVVGD
ncbi:MAG: hypothetical protein KF912_08685 [Phycisphaeraceae bacterium]|nr:hypothetical protein [Phycisphaeraceae bacterium]